MWESSFIAGDESAGDECCRCVSVAPVRSSVHAHAPTWCGPGIDGRAGREFNPEWNFFRRIHEPAVSTAVCDVAHWPGAEVAGILPQGFAWRRFPGEEECNLCGC
jgi:hypothetical protein